jgi:hypothetical protein
MQLSALVCELEGTTFGEVEANTTSSVKLAPACTPETIRIAFWIIALADWTYLSANLADLSQGGLRETKVFIHEPYDSGPNVSIL